MAGLFVINEKLPSLNEVINKNRTNKYAAAKQKKDIEETISLYILKALSSGALKPMSETPCELYITWTESTRRRDVDNIQSSQKFILDALQKSGVIMRDSRRYVTQIHHYIRDGTRNSVKVELKPVEIKRK